MSNIIEQKIMFSKMHGLGNDFMIVDAVTQDIFFTPQIIRRLANRYLGIGFDQLLIVEPPSDPEVDFHYRIFNADGSEVNQCGNGARCFALFVHLKGLTNKRDIHLSTRSGRVILSIINEKSITVNMGEPNFEPQQIPIFLKRSKNISFKKDKNIYLLHTSDRIITFSAVSIGNPHCIIQVKSVEKAPVEILGPLLGNHKIFPEGVNVGFVEIVNSGYIRLRVYERGVGETKACGSGACAAVACGIYQNILAQKVQVDLLNGTLFISWKGIGTSIFMNGPATHVYDGMIYKNQIIQDVLDD